MRVVAVDHRFGDLALERELIEPAGGELVDAAGWEPDAVMEACAGARAILLGARFQFDRERIGALRECRAIVRYGVGYENVDVEAAGEAGIAVATVPDYCVEEVSDHALALLLALNRRLFGLARHVEAGEWSTAPAQGVPRLTGLALGVVGYGRIGSALGRKARGIGLRVLAFDPGRPAEELRAEGAEPTELDPLLEVSDFVSLHAPGGGPGPLLDTRRIALMKKTACVVNVARGELVDEAALADALREGRLEGAALDVTEPEPPPDDSPLRSAPNLILTPHAAWFSTEAVRELRTGAAEEVARVLRGEPPQHSAVE
jgi:D-3-phosphoglycerate dehydrogenase